MTTFHHDACGKTHTVQLADDGTLDTVLEIDGRELRYNTDDRPWSRRALQAWMIENAKIACDAGELK